MYVVAGVSGKTGSVVAETLLSAGKKVRVIVRDAAKGELWRARGADVAVASLDDALSLGRALEGATGAYLLSPQDPASADPISDGWRIGDAMARAVETRHVPHLVFLSTMGAERADGTGIARTLHAAEERLAGVPTAITLVRGAYFLQNWAPSLSAAAQGVFPTFIEPERQLAMVSTRDLGLVAARALLEGPPAARRSIADVVGPREYCPRVLAELAAKLLGRPVAVAHAPLDSVVPTLTSFGASPAFAQQVQLLHQAIEQDGFGALNTSRGRLVRGTETAEDVFATLTATARP
jgi:uncharacterized protein YbjT (DUF2867 family)